MKSDRFAAVIGYKIENLLSSERIAIHSLAFIIDLLSSTCRSLMIPDMHSGVFLIFARILPLGNRLEMIVTDWHRTSITS
jgi:hypothetical protein